MESLLICGDTHKISDINIILINEQCQADDKLLYFISVFTTRGRFDYFSSNTLSLVQFELSRLNTFLKNHCVYEFESIDKSFLINMRNTEHVQLHTSSNNEFLVRATFTNGKKMNLYHGFQYQLANKYTHSYNDQLARYSYVHDLN